MFRKAGILTIIFIIGMVFTAVATAGASFMSFSPHKVIPHVSAGDINLAGMTREEVKTALNRLAEQLRSQTVILKHGDQSWRLPLANVGVYIDTEAVTEAAMQVGRRGTVWERWNEQIQVRKNGFNIPLPVELDGQKLKSEVDKFLTGITYPPVNATLHVASNGEIEVNPGRDGRQVDYEALQLNLEQLLANGSDPLVVEMPVVRVPPSRREEDIRQMKINGLLSSFTTRFNPDQAGRTYNIRVAAAALDGLIIPPGKEFSFNEVVGPRSSEAGYKNAKVILNNKLVDGLGGGVCQVSTTLYNAVLLADLTITERNNHSMPVSYVPIGRDATVAFNYLDFCFRNDTDSHILLKTTVGQATITVKIYGNTVNKKQVTIKSWVSKVLEPDIVYQDDPNLPSGTEVVKQEGVPGYLVSGIISVKEGQESISRPLPESLYRSKDEIIAVGTGPVEKKLSPEESEIPLQGGNEYASEEEVPPGNNAGSPNNEEETALEGNAEPSSAGEVTPEGESGEGGEALGR